MLDRFSSVWQGNADNRSHIWRRAWPLVTRFPLAGVGGGGYSTAEFATRTTYEGSFISVSAHNEYLEALIEGGIVRFTLTIVLAVAVRLGRSETLLAGAIRSCSAACLAFRPWRFMPSASLAFTCPASRSPQPLSRPAQARRGHGRTGRSRDRARHHDSLRDDYRGCRACLLAALLVVLADWRGPRQDRAPFVGSPGSAARRCRPVPRSGSATVRPNDPNVWEELASAVPKPRPKRGRQPSQAWLASRKWPIRRTSCPEAIRITT